MADISPRDRPYLQAHVNHATYPYGHANSAMEIYERLRDQDPNTSAIHFFWVPNDTDSMDMTREGGVYQRHLIGGDFNRVYEEQIRLWGDTIRLSGKLCKVVFSPMKHDERLGVDPEELGMLLAPLFSMMTGNGSISEVSITSNDDEFFDLVPHVQSFLVGCPNVAKLSLGMTQDQRDLRGRGGRQSRAWAESLARVLLKRRPIPFQSLEIHGMRDCDWNQVLQCQNPHERPNWNEYATDDPSPEPDGLLPPELFVSSKWGFENPALTESALITLREVSEHPWSVISRVTFSSANNMTQRQAELCLDFMKHPTSITELSYHVAPLLSWTDELASSYHTGAWGRSLPYDRRTEATKESRKAILEEIDSCTNKLILLPRLNVFDDPLETVIDSANRACLLNDIPNKALRKWARRLQYFGGDLCVMLTQDEKYQDEFRNHMLLYAYDRLRFAIMAMQRVRPRLEKAVFGSDAKKLLDTTTFERCSCTHLSVLYEILRQNTVAMELYGHSFISFPCQDRLLDDAVPLQAVMPPGGY